MAGFNDITDLPQYQVVLRLAAVALELAVGLDDHHVDVEGREPGRVRSVALVAVAALEGRGSQPAHEGLPAQSFQCRRALVVGHDAPRQLRVLKASTQVHVLHHAAGDQWEGGKK